MKKQLIVMVLFFLSCGQVDNEQPENLIGEEKMADLIFELALFDASKAFIRQGETTRIGLDSDSFYEFHNIDSIQFASSNSYYAKHPKAYLRIINTAKKNLEEFTKSVEDIQNKKTVIDTLRKKPFPKPKIDE